jgi:hypothetical protein
MKRRQFCFWIGLGLFQLSEKLHFGRLDQLAAAVMESTEPTSGKPTHWRANSNSAWQWYELETLVDGEWKLAGMTTPVSVATGEPFSDREGYLDDRLVPSELRVWDDDDDRAAIGKTVDPKDRQPNDRRKSRHGRPPSRWLRSLHADELRIWLRTIDVPEASVSGMTYFTHLTRDHFFDADRIKDLSLDEQALLHGAAHHGY